MAFSRKQMAAAVAGTLSLAMLTGCPAAAPTGTTPSTGTSAAPATTAPTTSAAPTTGTSAAPTTGTSAAPSTDASGNPTSPVPTASGPAPSGRTVILSGNVYDEEGATVDGASITVKSLDASVPYSATATSQAGSWVVNNVPEGANVEIIATKDGWTTRRRVGSFQQQATGKRNVINFGAAGGSSEDGDDDVTGEAYFISDYPEIVATTPADESTDFDSTKVTFKLTFSEPLTEDSRENFEDVFTVLPASAEATDGGDTTDFVDLETEGEDNVIDDLDGVSFKIASFEYNLQEGDAFLGSSRTKMTASWNSEGTEVTFSFGGAILADENETAKYQMALVVDNAGDEIEDEDGNQLGTNAAGRLDGAYAAGDLIYNAFKEEDLSIDSTDTSGDDNWSYTHDTVSNFEVREDDTTPKLTSVDVTEEGDSSRIELVFSEPMAAYGTNGNGIYGDGLFDIENYTFAVGEDNGDLDDVDLEGKAEAEVTAGLDIDADNIEDLEGAADADVNDGNYDEEFFFNDTDNSVEDDQSLSIDTVEDNGDDIFMELDEDNPTTLFIWFVNRADFFDNVNEIKARAEGVSDPAGNEIEDKDADANVVEAGV